MAVMHLKFKPPFRRLTSGALAILAIGLLTSCQSTANRSPGDSREQTEALKRLEQRMLQLEQRVNPPLTGSDQGNRVPPGPIKSITFRSGTADDRVRIYWANGERTDLPCTLEQGTWACG